MSGRQAAYKAEFQPFNHSYSQLTFFIFLVKFRFCSLSPGAPWGGGFKVNIISEYVCDLIPVHVACT